MNSFFPFWIRKIFILNISIHITNYLIFVYVLDAQNKRTDLGNPPLQPLPALQEHRRRWGPALRPPQSVLPPSSVGIRKSGRQFPILHQGRCHHRGGFLGGGPAGPQIIQTLVIQPGNSARGY